MDNRLIDGINCPIVISDNRFMSVYNIFDF